MSQVKSTCRKKDGFFRSGGLAYRRLAGGKECRREGFFTLTHAFKHHPLDKERMKFKWAKSEFSGNPCCL
jgi:hypothetical protein